MPEKREKVRRKRERSAAEKSERPIDWIEEKLQLIMLCFFRIVWVLIWGFELLIVFPPFSFFCASFSFSGIKIVREVEDKGCIGELEQTKLKRKRVKRRVRLLS